MAGAVTAGAALLFAQVTSFPAQAEMRGISFTGFTEISVRAGLDMRVEVGPEFSIEMEGKGAAIDTVDIHLEGATLVVDRKRGWRETLLSWSSDDRKVTVHVAAPTLDGVTADAGASVTVSGVVEHALRAEAFAGAAMALTGINGAALDIVADAGASVVAAGTCSEMAVRASGGASVYAANLDCATAIAEASGGASVIVSAHETLSLQASGGGSLIASGGGVVLRQEASSGGSLIVQP